MLTTWLLASDALVADRFRLRVAREVRDPFTGAVMRATGPVWVWDELSDLPYFQIDGITLAAVALLFDIDALEELDRTHALDGLPALYRVPAAAVAAFHRGLTNRKLRARSFAERARAAGLSVGIDIGASPPFLERSGAWRAETLPDTETELFEAFATLVEDAEPGMAILALAEET